MKKSIKNNTESLGGRLKGLEADYETRIESEKHIIVRIDGHKFSKFTKGFKKPFDDILSKAFELTSLDLAKEYQAVCVYQQSDEITLIIPSLMTKENHKGTNKALWEHSYGGRVQKMCSLIAGYTTMRFNKHLGDIANEYYEMNITSYTEQEDIDYILNIQNNKVGNAYFDTRMYGVDSDEEAFNSVMWRIRDCIKNSKSLWSQATLAKYYMEQSNS